MQCNGMQGNVKQFTAKQCEVKKSNSKTIPGKRILVWSIYRIRWITLSASVCNSWSRSCNRACSLAVCLHTVCFLSAACWLHLLACVRVYLKNVMRDYKEEQATQHDAMQCHARAMQSKAMQCKSMQRSNTTQSNAMHNQVQQGKQSKAKRSTARQCRKAVSQSNATRSSTRQSSKECITMQCEAKQLNAKKYKQCQTKPCKAKQAKQTTAIRAV